METKSFHIFKSEVINLPNYLQTFELLDRFEVLFPENQMLADLRRSYIDHDLSSIFRLCSATEELRKAVIDKNIHSIFRVINAADVKGDLEDLRKAVVDQNLHSLFRLVEDEELRKAVTEDNLHSIFRLLQNEDLRKLVMEDNTWSLWKLLADYQQSQFVAAFKSFFVDDVSFDPDCFARGQLHSKIWLVQELERTGVELGTVFLCAGWYATLATMIFESEIPVTKIRSFDIDPTCIPISKIFNKPWLMDDWKFNTAIEDIHNIDFVQHTYTVYRSNGSEAELSDVPDTIINTSCEHIDKFDTWYAKIPKGKLVVLQCNDYFEIKEHINCAKDLKAFAEQTPLSEVLYSGELTLPKYNRFMRIGYK